MRTVLACVFAASLGVWSMCASGVRGLSLEQSRINSPLEDLWVLNASGQEANFTIAGSNTHKVLLVADSNGLTGYNSSNASAAFGKGYLWFVGAKNFWGGPLDKLLVAGYYAIATSKNCTPWPGLGDTGASSSDFENVQVIRLDGTTTAIEFQEPDNKAVFGYSASAGSNKGVLVRVQRGQFLVGYALSISGSILFNISHPLPNATRLEIGESTFTVIHYPHGMSGTARNSQFDLKTGQFLCGFDTVQFLPTPTIAGDLVFGGSPFQHLYNATTCVQQSRSLVYLPYALGNTWYYETESNQLQRFNSNGASLAWSVPINPAALPAPYTTNFAPTQYQPDAFVEAEYLGAGQTAVFAVRNATTGQPLWISNVTVQTDPQSTIYPLGDGNIFIPAFLGGYSILNTAGSGKLVVRDTTSKLTGAPLSFLDPQGKPFVVWKGGDNTVVAKKLVK